MSQGPPEEPHLRSDFALLSPASPKPLHFPTPTNIPVLDKMMDIGFNQTEAHMADPAMHNPGLRDGAWQEEPAVKEEEPLNNTAPGANAEDATTGVIEGAPASDNKPTGAEVQETTSDAAQIEPASQAADLQGQSAVNVAQSDAPSESVAQAAQSADDAANVHVNPSVEGEATQTAATPLNGEVNVAALLNSFQANPAVSTPAANVAPAGEALNITTTLASSQTQPNAPGLESTPLSAAGLGAPPSGLPPRPPPQEQPLMHPNYTDTRDIRDYHPHAGNNTYQSANNTGSAGSPYAYNTAQLSAPADLTASAMPTFTSPTSQQRGTAANHQRQASSTPLESSREYKSNAGIPLNEDDKPWTQETQVAYDKFLDTERGYVSEGKWEQFPYGSRLFVGNLSSERVTKRDMYHVFHKYGELAQISIKNAYGFIQFLNVDDCRRALNREEGREVRGKNIHLEISKPQPNRRGQHNNQGQDARGGGGRSRTPEFNRDRFNSSRAGYGRDRNGGHRGYQRSPSPPRRDSRAYGREYRDRSPPRGYGRNSYDRGPSPAYSDDRQRSRRPSQDVPHVQIIVMDRCDPRFVDYVVNIFRSRNLKLEVQNLDRRASIDDIMHRALAAGVLGVCRLHEWQSQQNKVNLRIFDRSAGQGSWRYDDYDGQDPNICAELILREKNKPSQTASYGSAAPSYQQPQQAPQMSYGGYAPQPQQGYGAMPPMPAGAPTGFPPGYGQPQAQAQPQQQTPTAASGPDLQRLITSLNPTDLQSLLTRMGTQSQLQTPQTATAAAIPTPQSSAAPRPQYQQPQHHYPQPMQTGQAPQQPQGGQTAAGGQTVDMQEILAKLGTYSR